MSSLTTLIFSSLLLLRVASNIPDEIRSIARELRHIGSEMVQTSEEIKRIMRAMEGIDRTDAFGDKRKHHHKRHRKIRSFGADVESELEGIRNAIYHLRNALWGTNQILRNMHISTDANATELYRGTTPSNSFSFLTFVTSAFALFVVY
uniref:Uncharacterized protein n=1 Tax=Pristionchus pacificus TaxID=54126 RepID=A0A8R1V3F5_PRIPA